MLAKRGRAAYAGDRSREMGASGRSHVLSTFSIERLVVDVDVLYRQLLDQRSGSRRALAVAG